MNIDGHELECCWIEIINSKKCNTIIGTVYRHPTKKDKLTTEKIKSLLHTLKKENKQIIIAGDFNHNLLRYEENDYINFFRNTMLENNLQPCIPEPTRIVNSQAPSPVDNIFINKIDNPICGNILENLSYDHLPNFIILDSEPLRSTLNTSYRDTRNFDENKFTTDLNDPNMIRNINNAKDTNTAYNILHKKFVNTLNQHAPVKIRSKRETKIKQKPWLTNDILISIKKKRLLFKKLKKLKVNNINDNNLFQQYKQYRNLINTLKRQSKISFYKEYFQAKQT